jgi:MerR family redox-sensitive transcriptional activator SoxR
MNGAQKASMRDDPVPVDLSVGELARRSGVAISTIHFYEARGLICGWRTAGNQRRFPRETLRRVALVRVAQRVGIPLADIATALATLPKGRAPGRADWARLSRSWRAQLDARIAQLSRLRDTLDDCIGCGCLSIDRCALRNPADHLANLGPGPLRLWVVPLPSRGAAPVKRSSARRSRQSAGR